MSVAESFPVEQEVADQRAGEQFQHLAPDSLLWKMSGDWRAAFFAGRVLIMQVAHPVVGAGVGEHSVYKTDPYGRLDRTTRSSMRLIYGGPDAHLEGERLRELHRDIKGVDDKGRRYSALHPESYLWVHATAFELGLVFHELFGTPLTADQTERLFQDWRTVGWTLGISEHHLPKTQGEFWDFWYSVLPKLEDNKVVQDLLWGETMPPPKVPEFLFRPLDNALGNRSRAIAALTLPEELRERIGLPALTAEEERKVRRLCNRMRVLGQRLPDKMLMVPMAAKAAKARTAEIERQRMSA